MDNNSIPTVKQNTLENNIKLFIDTNNDYLKSNLDQTEQLLKSFRNQKITLIEQKQIGKNLGELFMNFIPNKNNQYIYQSVIMEVKNLVEKEENIILFKAIQDEANTSCYGSFWNKVITESNFSEKTQEYIDFNKISTYSLFLKDTKLSDITKSKFINQQIAKNELLFIVNNYDTVDELLSEETRKDLVEKIQKKYSEGIIYKTLLIGEFYNLNEEIQKSFIYNISLELIKIDEFYDYNIVNPPLVSGYDLEETITTINFDEEVNPNDEDVIDQYIGFGEYKYDKENENFYKEDENGKIVYEISLDDARSEVQQSRFETFEFDLGNRFDLNNKDLFKEEYSNYRNSVDIKYDKLNGLDENKSFDEYIGDYISDKTNHQNIERINYDSHENIFNHILEELYPKTKFKNDFSVITTENISNAFDNYFSELNNEDKIFLTKELHNNDGNIELKIKDGSENKKYYKYFDYENLIVEYKEYVTSFIEQVNDDFVVDESDYYDIKNLLYKGAIPEFDFGSVKEVPEDFNYEETLKNIENNFDKLTRSKFHYKKFNNLVPAYTKNFFNKEKTINHLKAGNLYIFENKSTNKFIESLNAKETYEIYKSIISQNNKSRFLDIIDKNTSNDFKVKLFDEVKYNLGKDVSNEYIYVLKKIIPSVIEATGRNPIIELAELKIEKNIHNLNMVYKLMTLDSDNPNEVKVYRDYVLASINDGLDGGINNSLFKEQEYSLKALLNKIENKDLLYKLYELSFGKKNDIADILLGKKDKTILDIDVFCKYYSSNISLEHTLLTNIDKIIGEDKDLANYVIIKSGIIGKLENSESEIRFSSGFYNVAHLINKDSLIKIFISEKVNNNDKVDIFEKLLQKNPKLSDSGKNNLYDFQSLGEDIIKKIFDIYSINDLLNRNSSSFYSHILPEVNDYNFLKNNYIISIFKNYLKENFGYIGEISKQVSPEPSFIKTDYLVNKLKNSGFYKLGFDNNFLKYLSYDNIKSIVEIKNDNIEGYHTLLSKIFEYISENDYKNFYTLDKNNGYIITRKLVYTGYGINNIKIADYITDDFIELINKDYMTIGVKTDKLNIFSIQDLLIAKVNSDLYLPKLSNLSNKKIIDGLYNLGHRYFTCDFFSNLNSEDSLYLLNHKIYSHNDLYQTYKIIGNLNTKDFNTYLKDFIHTRYFGNLIKSYGDEMDFSNLDPLLIDSLNTIFTNNGAKLEPVFLDILFKCGYSKEKIIKLVDISKFLEEEKIIVKKLLNKYNAKISDIIRIINDRALEELESEIEFSINDMIDNNTDYNKIPQVKFINDINRKYFTKAGINIENFNGFKDEINFSSSDKIDIKNIYNNLESSLVNQYKVLFGEGENKGLIHGIDKSELHNVSNNVLNMYNISLKELGKNIKGIHKGVGLDLDNNGLYLKDNTSFKNLGKNAKLLINSMGESSQIIDKAFLFKDEFIETLDKTEKIIFNKVKKSVSMNIDALYKDEKIDNSKVDEINNFLFNVNTIELSREVDMIIKNISNNSKTVIQKHINSFNNKNLKGILKKLDLEKITSIDLKIVSSYIKILKDDDKKNLGILIKEYKKLEYLNNLKSNCNNTNINNFKTIFDKLNKNSDLNNIETKDNFNNISSILVNKNTNLHGFICKVEELYKEIPGNKEIQQLYNYIVEIKIVLKHFNDVRSSIINHIKDDFGNIDVNKIKKLLSEKRDYTIKVWDRSNIVENLNQGYYSHCCISPTGVNGWSMPKYIISENFNVIEIRSNNKIVGQAFCYIGINNDKYNLVIDNVEINNTYSMDSELIKKKLIIFTNNYKNSIGNLDDTIKIGDNYNDVIINGQALNTSSIIGYKDMYLDSKNKQREFK